MKKILVTGASGFIGQSLCNALSKTNRSIYGVVRKVDSSLNSINIDYKIIRNIGLTSNWKDILKNVDCIFHCAGIAHQVNDSKDLSLYHLINVEGTKRLAEQAAEAGVRRLIFLSSIKVNGESTSNNLEKFLYNDIPKPKDAYAISKFKAEKLLFEISANTEMEVVVIRMPLVYGLGAKGNLNNLIKLINYNIPLPFSSIKNKRSLLGIDNLIDILIKCIRHPNAQGKTFLVSDGEDVPTPKLIKLIASSLKKKAYLFPLPNYILKFLGLIFGKSEEINKLVGSLRVDHNYTTDVLNWTPPISVEEGIRRMVQDK